MYLLLVAYMCFGNDCRSARVTDNFLSPQMSIMGCMTVEGQLSAARFVAENYHAYKLTKWVCQVGKRPVETAL